MSLQKACNIILVFLFLLFSNNNRFVVATSDPVVLLDAPDLPEIVSPVNQAIGIPTTTMLKVHVTDPESDNLSVSFYGRPKNTNAGPNFILAALPDTQNYTLSPEGAAIFNAQTQWIVDNQSTSNIAFVTHLGDITEDGDYNFDLSQWEIASNAMSILERDPSDLTDDVPFSLSKGNHDVSEYFNRFEQYFGIWRFTGRPYYGGHYGSDNLNSYSLFSASGMHFIVINLAYDEPAPSVSVLDWADDLLKDDLSRRGIVVLHDMFGGLDVFSQAGEAVYDALKDNPNLFLTLCGHYLEGQRTDLGADGHKINSLMADYQYDEDGTGGGGWMRLMEFQPANNRIQVKTFSPTQNNGAGDYQTDSDSQFTLAYPMRSPDFTLLGTVQVASGSDASITWTGLLNNTKYEWYAAARDPEQITVSPVQVFTTEPMNSAPVAHNDSYTTNENSTLTVGVPGVLVNDTDVDNDPLTASLLSGPSHGTLVLNSNGSFIYDPVDDYSGSDSFAYKAYDGIASSSTATVNITVAHINYPPVAADDSAVTLEDTPVEIDVLSNDEDANDDSLVVSGVTNPPHGTSKILSSGKVLYTPDTGFYGSDSFQYSVTDGSDEDDTANIYVTVTHVNHAPVAKNGSLTIDEDTAGSVTLVGSDRDQDAFNFILLSSPEHGTLNGTPPGLTYTPKTRYYGTDRFTFKTFDGAASSSPATVTITVVHVNLPPSAENDSIETLEDTPAEIDVLSNDDDADEDPLTVSSVSKPSHGTAKILANGNVQYTPDTGFHGSDTFQYIVADNHAEKDTAIISVWVAHVNHAPVASNGSLITDEDTPASVTMVGSDRDQDVLTYILLSSPQHGTLSGTPPALLYTPSHKYYGTDRFTFKVMDGNLESATATILVTVQSVNEAPQLDEISNQVAKKGILMQFAVTAIDNDLPPDTLSFKFWDCDSLVGAKIHPVTGIFTWTPKWEQSAGTFQCRVSVSDGFAETYQPVQITLLDSLFLPVIAP